MLNSVQPFVFVWLLFSASCSSIVRCCYAWRLKHLRMATHNESLHSLSSTKDNLLRITFHDSMIPLSGTFFCHHWNQNRISCLGRLSHQRFHWECVSLHTRWISETETRRLSILPLLEMLICFSLWVGNTAIWCFLHSARFSFRPCWYSQLSGMSFVGQHELCLVFF